VADRLLKPKEAAKFKLKLWKLLAAVKKKRVSPLTIKTFAGGVASDEELGKAKVGSRHT